MTAIAVVLIFVAYLAATLIGFVIDLNAGCVVAILGVLPAAVACVAVGGFE